MKKIVLMVCFLCFSANAIAERRNTNISSLDRMYAYDDYGSIEGKDGADVAIWTDTGLSECPNGVWISPSAPGYKTMVSFVLSAYLAQKKVSFQVYSDKVWGGSRNALCKVDAVRFD